MKKTPQFVIPKCDIMYQSISGQNETYFKSVELQQYIIATKAFRSFSVERTSVAVGRTEVPVKRTEQSQKPLRFKKSSTYYLLGISALNTDKLLHFQAISGYFLVNTRQIN